MNFLKEWLVNSIILFAIATLVMVFAIVAVCFVAWELPEPGLMQRMAWLERAMLLVSVALGFVLEVKSRGWL